MDAKKRTWDGILEKLDVVIQDAADARQKTLDAKRKVYDDA